MELEQIFKLMDGDGQSDYEKYLKTHNLFVCQKKFDDLATHDEHMFQSVHQSEELLLRTINFTLIEILKHMAQQNTCRVMTLFKRVHASQKICLDLFDLLTTMSPKDYQEIRVHLGGGSGMTSPGFRAMLVLAPMIWQAFKKNYLKGSERNIEKIYDSEYVHDGTYLVAEEMLEFDALFRLFLSKHFLLIERTIGLQAKSLTGRSVKILEKSLRRSFFPKLWEIRSKMTNNWGEAYGYVRKALDA